MTKVSTSAADLRPPLGIGTAGMIPFVQPRPQLANYAPILVEKPIVWTVENRPTPARGILGKGVDLLVTEALRSLLRAEPTGLAIEGLRRALSEQFNRAPPGAQFAVIGTVAISALTLAITNAGGLIANLGNATFSLDVPLRPLGLQGVKLSLQVALSRFNPRLSMVVLQLAVAGGQLSLRANLDQRTYGLGWELANGSVVVQVDGIGGQLEGRAMVRFEF